MRKIMTYIVCIGFLISCENTEKKTGVIDIPMSDKEDPRLVLNDTFATGDVRRYGIFPNTLMDRSTLNEILEMATGGPQLYFAEGHYPIDISIEGLSNISMYFDNASLGGALIIIDNDNKESSNIVINGNLTVLDKIFIRKSNTIFFENIEVKSDTLNNVYHKRNRGVSIYVGSKDVNFKTLEISDTGGDEDAFFGHVAAALQVHGWDNNPSNLSIDHLRIINAARSAMYLTGFNHKIKKIEIANFGLGNDLNMLGLEDAKAGDEKAFSGVWINKCNDCVIDSLTIRNDRFKKGYSIHFGMGNYAKPTFINNLQFVGGAKKMDLKDDPLTNILVKSAF